MSNRTLTLLMGFVAFLILIVGVVFVIAVVGGGGGGSNTTASTAPKTSSSGVTGDICQGNTLVTFGEDPASVLDPIQVRDVGTAEYIVEIFGGLVTLDLNLQVQPDIAASWKVSPDGKAYTFTLRDNVVFQNNRKVTAQDVKYSLERAADPINNSPTVTLYLGNIVGVLDRYNGKAKDVSGVKVIDDKTVEIDLIQPSDYFLAEMTQPVAFVVDQQQIQKDPKNWTQHPNGTGPFKLSQFTPADKVVLTRNDSYHLGAAKLDSVVFELGGGSLLTRYQNNELHIGEVPAIDLEAVKNGTSPLSPDYKPQPQMALDYIAFNTKQAPFDDPLVRQAFAMSIDRDKINTVLLYGTQRVATNILPPEMPGHSATVNGYSYDPVKAKQLLSQSKYANNMPHVVLTYAGAGGDAPDILTAIQSGWQDALGITVDLQASEYSAYLRDLRKGTYQMFDAGWAADYPDPEDFLDKLFASDSLQNEQGYLNPQVDALLKQARTETDRTKRFTEYSQAEQMILNDAAIIPTFWPIDHALVKPCVQNWPSVSMTVPKYRFISIDASKEK
jgi:oligopeptide transport system substrate-binding protein